MGYAGRHNIYEGAIRKMVTKALEAEEEAFREAHEADADAQLLAYVRQCAARLQHTPWPGEIPGGTVIAQRFGSWEKALSEAGLPAPQIPNKPSTFLRIRQEEERQKEIYRQKKAEKKLLAEKRKALQAAKKKAKEE